MGITQGKEEAQALLDGIGNVGDGESIRIVVQMPSGKRIEQAFSQECAIKHIRALILIQEETTALDFKVVSRFPNKTYSEPETLLSTAFNNAKSQLLLVEATKDETIEDDDDEETSSDDDDSSSE